MRSLISMRWLAVAAIIGLLSTLTAPVQASPQNQEPVLTIFAIGFVDVAGGDDPDCPGCNGEFDPEDEDFANATPLGTITFVVKDESGAEIARADTEPLATLERAMIDVPDLLDGETYTLELENITGDWQLCSNESGSRTLGIDDFQLGSTRQDFHFWMGCSDDTVPPTAVPTTRPGDTPVPTTVPSPGDPTSEPGDPGDDDDDDDDEDDNGSGGDSGGSGSGGDSGGSGSGGDSGGSGSGGSSAGSGSGGASAGTDGGKTQNGLGEIAGIAYNDLNGNGKLDANEPALNDVAVRLSGGGLTKNHTTGGDGFFGFCCIGTGEYSVSINPGSEWTVTTSSNYSVKVNGNRVIGIDFGLTRGAVHKNALAKKHDDRVVSLPSTGIADIPTKGLLGGLILALGLVAGLGFSMERRNREF
jgi:uncharacterized membrane protein YgcG